MARIVGYVATSLDGLRWTTVISATPPGSGLAGCTAGSTSLKRPGHRAQ